MNFFDTFSIAIRAILVNKTRSFLTMLGVIIGVGAVILLVAIGSGLQSYISEQFDTLGVGMLTIMPGEIKADGSGLGGDEQVASMANSKLREKDISELRRLREFIQYVSPIYMQQSESSYKDKKKKTSIIGTSADFQKVLNLQMSKGEFLSEEDSSVKRRVAILGSKITEDLFGNVDPIGKTVAINGQSFKVIGVVEKKGGGFGGPSYDSYIYTPYTTFISVFDNEVLMEIVAKAKNVDTIDITIAQIKNTLGKRLKDDEFSVLETREILNVINKILGMLTAGLGGIAAISLVVGGIGIMNIMLVSVTERTREIGLRKAVGATPNQILLQFLIESSVLSVLGGLIGVGIATALAMAMNSFFPARVTMDAVMLAFFVSATIGIVFGVAPARRASKLSPIEALRYE